MTKFIFKISCLTALFTITSVSLLRGQDTLNTKKSFKLVDKSTLDFNLNEKDSITTITHPASFKQMYNSHLGIMCKLENRLNKSAKRPIKIRLGTVQYTEKLEYGKL